MTTTNIPVVRGPQRGSYFDWRSWLFWFLMAVWSIPLLWLVSMSLRFNEDILSRFEVIPSRISFRGYEEFFTNPLWYGSFINSLSYTTMNMVLSVAVALPAAYAFSRYTFSGDKHLFFWLLTNRMAPASIRPMRLPWPTCSSMCRWRCGSWRDSCPGFLNNSTR